MSEYCCKCSPFLPDYEIDLAEIALKVEKGHSENVICEGCNIKAIYKDDAGLLYLAKEVDGEIQLESITIEKLMG